MKHLFLRRFLPALLCLVFALSLTACGGETERPETEGGSGMTGALSGGKGNGHFCAVKYEKALDNWTRW